MPSYWSSSIKPAKTRKQISRTLIATASSTLALIDRGTVVRMQTVEHISRQLVQFCSQRSEAIATGHEEVLKKYWRIFKPVLRTIRPAASNAAVDLCTLYNQPRDIQLKLHYFNLLWICCTTIYTTNLSNGVCASSVRIHVWRPVQSADILLAARNSYTCSCWHTATHCSLLQSNRCQQSRKRPRWDACEPHRCVCSRETNNPQGQHSLYIRSSLQNAAKHTHCTLSVCPAHAHNPRRKRCKKAQKLTGKWTCGRCGVKLDNWILDHKAAWWSDKKWRLDHRWNFMLDGSQNLSTFPKYMELTKIKNKMTKFKFVQYTCCPQNGNEVSEISWLKLSHNW